MWRSIVLSLLLCGNILTETVEIEALTNNSTKSCEYSFSVDYDNNQFLLDGKPFRYVSGSFHYFRAPRQYWRDRLRKIRAAGLNAVSTYVEWSLHQPEEGRWYWSGDADIVEFFNIAQEEDLFVLLRPGPYICAERDLGGLPYWLLNRVPKNRLRTNDKRYLSYVEKYLEKILEKVKPYLRGNGGPIIMVQVENEYGSYNACNIEYMKRLTTIFHNKIGEKALLYTTDGTLEKMLTCGTTAGAYATIDFGSSANVTKMFELLRLYQAKGPLVNSEYYTGWLSSWEGPFERVKSKSVTQTLDKILAMGASVNLFMFYGGTNFGFTSGANGDDSTYYAPQLTSYDYDAPITEAGDLTEKYFAIKSTVTKYLPVVNISVSAVTPKGNYGAVLMEAVLELFEPISRVLFGRPVIFAKDPITFESLNLSSWLVLYETTLSSAHVAIDPVVLHAIPRDRGLVYMDGELSGTLSRSRGINWLSLENPYSKKLQILVENQGRLNYGNYMHDFKGIFDVRINGNPLIHWNMTGFPLDNVEVLKDYRKKNISTGTLRRGPAFLRGYFDIVGQPLDTFLDTSGWGKGVAYVNGHNLGRYWPLAGPQMTLYVPAVFLRNGTNELIVLELEYIPHTRQLIFQDKPNLDNKKTLQVQTV